MTGKTRFLPFTIFILSAIFSFNSCKNDLDINAKWKEIIVVYGTLNPNDTVQYIRVEKAYLDPISGALQVAKIADSLQLDSAIVTLTSANGVDTLKQIFYVPKDSGIFANNKNPLYKTNKKIDSNLQYRLDVWNPKTGTRVWAYTEVVMNAAISSPVRNSNSRFSCLQEFINISFVPKSNSHAYDVKMRLYYDEFSKTDTNTKVRKTADWAMVTNQPVEAGLEVKVLIPRLAFLQFLSSSIKADKNLYHRLSHIDMIWYGGNQTLVDYISVNQPSIGIVQKTAEYTNINGGYGIFGSRAIQRIPNVKIDPGSVSLLRVNAETVGLNILP